MVINTRLSKYKKQIYWLVFSEKINLNKNFYSITKCMILLHCNKKNIK